MPFVWRMEFNMSKGDTYRPVNKRKYDESYVRIFGIKCPGRDEYCSGCILKSTGECANEMLYSLDLYNMVVKLKIKMIDPD